MTHDPSRENRFRPVNDPYAKGPGVKTSADPGPAAPYRHPMHAADERRTAELGQPAEQRDPELDLKDATLIILKLIRGRTDRAAVNARAWLLRKGLMPNPLRASDEDPEVPV